MAESNKTTPTISDAIMDSLVAKALAATAAEEKAASTKVKAVPTDAVNGKEKALPAGPNTTNNPNNRD